MLVKTKTILRRQKEDRLPFDNRKAHDIKEVEVKYCCKPMEEAFREKYIGFGEFNVDRPLNWDNNVNIFHCSPYPEGAYWEAMAIKSCPWCKEEVKIQNIETKSYKTYEGK